VIKFVSDLIQHYVIKFVSDLIQHYVIKFVSDLIQHYVIKFVSDLRHVGGLFPSTAVSSPNRDAARHDITEILLNVLLTVITLIFPPMIVVLYMGEQNSGILWKKNKIALYFVAC
jgi:hypothetical protein